MALPSRSTDVSDVVGHAGGVSPGVAGNGSARVSERVHTGVWSSLVKRAASVGAGMIGLAAIGLVAGAPKSDRLDLMGVAPGLGDSWLAGAPSSASVEASPGPTETGVSEPGPAPAPANEASAAPSSGVTADGKVILNRANVSELTRLPGIGEKRAAQIVQLRERLGGFAKLTDLLRVKGIGPKSLRKMLPHLVLNPPPSPGGAGGAPGQ